MPDPAADIWPRELRVSSQGRIFELVLESGAHWLIPAELLRVESPSAEVKGHGPGQETLVWGKRDVTIRKLEAVGNYAVRIHFSDGHDSGIFTWTYLADIGANQRAHMARYEEKLKAAGLHH